MQTTKYKGTRNEIQLPGQVVKMEEGRKKKRLNIEKQNKKSNNMKNAEKERRVFPVSSGFSSWDFNRD